METYAGQLVAFVIGIVMARLLTPSAYGVIGMTTIFTCIADALIFAGFPTALIRKKDCTAKDYSTVFYYNLFVGIVMYMVMYFAAPYIADFYKMPELKGVCRVLGTLFIIGSLGGVSMTILRKEVRFKTIAIITLTVSITIGILAIMMAYSGWGVWALVYQLVAAAILRNAIVCIKAKWVPSLIFSKESFKELFAFGSKILGANIIVQIYSNLYNLLIGKFYNASSLAYYSRADGYSRLIPINIAGVIQKTLFPLLSKVQDDDNALRRANETMVCVSSFLIFPATMILAGVAYPIITVMISDKWIQTAPLLQLLCLGVLPDHLYYINNDFISIKGFSGNLMREQTYSKIITMVLLVGSLYLGLNWVVASRGIGALITYIMSCYYLKKAIGLGFKKQTNSIFWMLTVSILIGIADYVAFQFLPYTLIWLLVVVAISGGIYLLMSYLFFPSTLVMIKSLIKK